MGDVTDMKEYCVKKENLGKKKVKEKAFTIKGDVVKVKTKVKN